MKIFLHCMVCLLFWCAPALADSTHAVWQVRLAPPIAVMPAQSRDLLFVAHGSGQFAALQMADGRTRWTVSTGNTITATPIVLDDVVYLAGGDNVLYALDTRTGHAAWRWHLPVAADALTTPAVDFAQVYLLQHRGVLYAIDRASGHGRWSATLGDDAYAAPAVAQDHVMTATWSGEVTAFDTASGKVQWKTQVGSRVFAGLAATDDLVLIGTRAGSLIALDTMTGAMLWRTAVGNFVAAPPVIHEERNGKKLQRTAYVSTMGGDVVAVDLLSGRARWHAHALGTIRTAPSVDRTTVAVGSDDMFAYALRRNTGGKRWQYQVYSAVRAGALIHAAASPLVIIPASDGTVTAVRGE